MYLFGCEAVFEAGLDAVWTVWTDVAGWPQWDVSKEIAQLDGPFEPGARGWAKQRGNLGGPFTITAVDPGRRWVSACPVPLGTITFEHQARWRCLRRPAPARQRPRRPRQDDTPAHMPRGQEDHRSNGTLRCG